MKTVGSREGVIRTAVAAKVLEVEGGGGKSRVPWAVKNFFLQLSLNRLTASPFNPLVPFSFLYSVFTPGALGRRLFNECSWLKGEEKRVYG